MDKINKNYAAAIRKWKSFNILFIFSLVIILVYTAYILSIQEKCDLINERKLCEVMCNVLTHYSILMSENTTLHYLNICCFNLM